MRLRGTTSSPCSKDGASSTVSKPRDELQLVHGLFGFQHAGGHLIDLAGDVVRLLAVHGQFAERADLVFQPVDFQLHQLEVVAGPLQIGEPVAAGLQIVFQRLANALLLIARRATAGNRRQVAFPAA